MLTHAVLVVSLLFSAFAFAGPGAPQGVWNGFIGTKSIIACFNEGSSFTSYASYYYVDHLKPIGLAKRDSDSLWHEEDGSGLWEMSSPDAENIIGVWRNPKTQKTLPIKLSLVDGRDDMTACARDSYNARLETPPKVEIGKVVPFSSGRFYRKLRFAGQETVELFGTVSSIRKINASLALEKSKEAINAYFQQRREFLGRIGIPAIDEVRAEPTYWDAHFISVNFVRWQAGEGANGVSSEFRTWELMNGNEVDLWAWFGAKASDAKLPSKLLKFLLKNDLVEPECKAEYRGKGYFQLRLGRAGMEIYEEARGSGCEKNFVVPYSKLGPFLSMHGRQAVTPLIGGK